MYLEELEILKTVELIEYRTFKEKIDITRRYRGKARIEIIDNRFIYIERFRRGN